MKRVDVVVLKKSLDPIAGMSAHIQKDTLLHPRDDFKTAVDILELDGDFTLEDLHKIIEAFEESVEQVDSRPTKHPNTKDIIVNFQFMSAHEVIRRIIEVCGVDNVLTSVNFPKQPVELTDGGEAPSLSVLSCEDCGLPYDQFGLDTTLPNDQWLLIHPSGESGVLCATCIARRGHAVPGVVAVRAVFDNPIELLNGGEAPKAPPIEKFMIYLVHEGDYENRSVVRAYIGPCNLGDYYVLEDQFIEQHPELFVAVGTHLDKNHPQYKYNLMYEQRLELDRLYSDKFEDWLTMSLGLMAIPFMEIF